MSESQDFELDDDFVDEAEEIPEDESERKGSSKDSLEKRRLIDEMLEERRLQKQLKELDYDLDDLDDFDDEDD